MYSRRQLQSIARHYNKQFGTRINLDLNDTALYKTLNRYMSCSVGSCLNVRSRKLDEVLKPLNPNKVNQWLSNLDIQAVMKEYEKLYDNFIFLGAVPLDFQRIDQEVANFHLFQQPHDIVGIIFNTQPSTKSGQHWIALVIHRLHKTICFFDSYGNLPPRPVLNFIHKIHKQTVQHHTPYRIWMNRNRHQYGDTACGIYCLYFIVRQLQGFSCRSINCSVLSDKRVKEKAMELFVKDA